LYCQGALNSREKRKSPEKPIPSVRGPQIKEKKFFDRKKIIFTVRGPQIKEKSPPRKEFFLLLVGSKLKEKLIEKLFLLSGGPSIKKKIERKINFKC